MNLEEDIKREKSLNRWTNVYAGLTGLSILAAVAGGVVCYATDALNQQASFTVAQEVGMRTLAIGMACGTVSALGLGMSQISLSVHRMRKSRQDRQRS